MDLKNYEQAEIATYTLFFLIFIGLFRPLILNHPMDGHWAVIMTICFFIWYLLTKFFTNLIMSSEENI